MHPKKRIIDPLLNSGIILPLLRIIPTQEGDGPARLKSFRGQGTVRRQPGSLETRRLPVGLRIHPVVLRPNGAKLHTLAAIQGEGERKGNRSPLKRLFREHNTTGSPPNHPYPGKNLISALFQIDRNLFRDGTGHPDRKVRKHAPKMWLGSTPTPKIRTSKLTTEHQIHV